MNNEQCESRELLCNKSIEQRVRSSDNLNSSEDCKVILAFYRPTYFSKQVGRQMHSSMTKEQKISEHVETNDLGQVKIALSAKVGKWVWVNAKQYQGILK